MNLVIVESPSKCKKIAAVLGSSYRVVATMGHIRALDADLNAIGIDNNFELRYSFIKEKGKAMKQILDCAQTASTIYLSADDDREGEAIAYSVACLLKRDVMSFPRAVFHEITEKAIKHAIANPRKLDMNRVYSQQARSVLDMMVGFTISPLLWKYVARGLSAGRCQTPALRLISERENLIKSHITESTWQITGDFEKLGKVSMVDQLEDQESILNYLENVYESNMATVTSVKDIPWSLSAPKALITSTLQQEASALHSYTPKETMRIAQALYEAGHITYMRTDSHVLSKEAVDAAHSWIKEKHGNEYIGIIKTPVKSKKEEGVAAQEAHEAIRPTHMEVAELPVDEEWGQKERKLYGLIWRRAIQSTMSSAKGNTHTTLLNLDPDEDKFTWSSSIKKTDFYGWQILGKTAVLDEEDEEDENVGKSVSMKIGDKVKWTTLSSFPKRSKASPRFTEATLVRELERNGIGRPSTFASLIDTLFEKQYIEKKDIPGTQITNLKYTLQPNEWPASHITEKTTVGKETNKLVPTHLGESVLKFCVTEFPNLFEYEFTSKMEKRLDDVSTGKEDWKEVCKDTWNSYKDRHELLNDKASKPTNSEKVREFTNGLKAVMSKGGPLLVQENGDGIKPTFYKFPEGESFQDITEESARKWIKQLGDDMIFGELNGVTIYKKKGPYGLYIEYSQKRIPYVEGDTLETVIKKIQEKKELTSNTRVGNYIFAVGQYGPYMYKETLKTRQFISIPSSINTSKLTPDEADNLYKKLLEDKKSKRGRRK